MSSFSQTIASRSVNEEERILIIVIVSARSPERFDMGDSMFSQVMVTQNAITVSNRLFRAPIGAYHSLAARLAVDSHDDDEFRDLHIARSIDYEVTP
jgi:hypothetical protein